jgi:O-antigen/teichoic acid export membrane protein
VVKLGETGSLPPMTDTLEPSLVPRLVLVPTSPAKSMKRSLRSAVVFGVGNGLTPGIGFLLLPVYTRALTPAQYGPLSVLLAVSSAAGMLFSFGLDLGLFRSFFALADDPIKQRRFLASAWRFLIFAPLTGAIALTAVGGPFITSIHGVSVADLFLALVAGALYAAATVVPLVVLRVNERLLGYIVVSGANAVATTVFVFVAVVVLHLGITGWLGASAASNALLLAASAIVLPWYREESFDWALLRGPLRFGLTLIPHAFALWAIILADRIVLSGLVSARQLGLYSLAANIGVPIGFATAALNQSLLPRYAKAGLDDGERRRLGGVIAQQVTLTTAIALAGALLGGTLVTVLAAPSYHAAAPLVTWIALGQGLTGLYLIPMNGATIGAGKSAFVWVISGLAAVTNVVLLLLFVPSHGILAAAIAYAVTGLVLVVGISVYSRSPGNPNTYRWLVILGVIAAAAVSYAGAAITAPGTSIGAGAARLAWLAVFGGAAAALIRADGRGAKGTDDAR